MELKQKQVILYEIQAWRGSQWSWASIGVVCTFGDAQTTRRAAVLTWVLHCGNNVDFYHQSVFLSIHLISWPANIWQCLCSSISRPALLTMCPSISFDSICVHPSHHLQTHLTLWQCLCSSISWQYCYLLLLTVCLSSHLMTCRHFWQCVHPYHDPQTHLTMCSSISWPAHFWQCLCPSISWPADTFDDVCVHPSHDLQTHLTVFLSIHLMTCTHLTMFVSIHLMTCRHMTVFESIHLMTCRHFWQCLCPSTSSDSWAADTFDNASIHLMTCTHLTVCSSISWPAYVWQCLCSSICRHFGQCLCSSISWPAHIWQCLCPSISWPADTFDSVFIHLMTCTLLTVFIHLMTCRHFWQCLCPSILWPADNFDNVCVHPSDDLQTFLTVFASIYLMTCGHFWQWAFLCFYFLQTVSRVQFDTDAIILYFRHHDKDMLSTCGT